jgi:hypothetical protein
MPVAFKLQDSLDPPWRYRADYLLKARDRTRECVDRQLLLHHRASLPN